MCSTITLMRRQVTITYEKAARSTRLPRRRIINSSVRHRLICLTWHSSVQSLMKGQPNTLSPRETLAGALDSRPGRRSPHRVILLAHSAWKGPKNWNTGYKDDRISVSSGNVPAVVLHPRSVFLRQQYERHFLPVGTTNLM